MASLLSRAAFYQRCQPVYSPCNLINKTSIFSRDKRRINEVRVSTLLIILPLGVDCFESREGINGPQGSLENPMDEADEHISGRW